MNNPEQSRRFYPSRQRGSLYLGGLLSLFLLLAAAFFWLSANTQTGWLFVLYLAGGIAACLPMPMLTYRLVALHRAYYDIDRNALTLHWGLRTEILPLQIIEWYRPLTDLTAPLPTPPMPLAGAYIGIRMIEGLGKVEYLADSYENGLLIAAPHSVFVISPALPDEFLATFHRGIEMGSLETVEAESIQPSFVLNKLWDDRVARILILSSLGLGLLLTLWTVILVTTVPMVIIGFSPLSDLIEPVPSIRLLLFPVLAAFIFLVDLVGGTFFYRRADERSASYLLWAGGVITSALLIVSLLMTTLRL
jgi:hypothetical protein